jgi:hypothetical protein
MVISFCTVSMNRLHHIKQCLVKNMLDNFPMNPAVTVEFVLLDYNSSDGLEDWVKENLQEYLQSGKLVFYRTTEPQYFQRSHSRNMVFKLAGGDVVCNIDADNFMGKGFADYVYNFFKEEKSSFLTPSFSCRDVIGKVCIDKKHFLHVSGYDEQMEGYGYEDLDLYNRLVHANYSHSPITESGFNKAIQHSHEERFKNEYTLNNILAIYISYISVYVSELLFLYKDFTYESGRIFDNAIFSLKESAYSGPFGSNSEAWHSKFFKFREEHSLINIDGEWEGGSWQRDQQDIISLLENGVTIKYLKEVGLDLQESKKKKFFKINSAEFLSAMIMFKTEIANRKRMNTSTENSGRTINLTGFGKGKAFKNFDLTHEIAVS